MHNNVIVAFDFDGTLTTKDTLLEFIKFSKGKIKFYGTFLLFSPLLVLYKIKVYPNWKIKEKIFSFLFKGMDLRAFNALGNAFYQEKGKKLLRDGAFEVVSKHNALGHETIIITASIENWVRPFTDALRVHYLQGTVVEVSEDGFLTGKFLSKNCYGAEKVERLNAVFPHRNTYKLISYGDSEGDYELFSYSDEYHFRSLK